MTEEQLLEKFPWASPEGVAIRNLIQQKNYYKALSDYITKTTLKPDSLQEKPSDISNNQIKLNL